MISILKTKKKSNQNIIFNKQVKPGNIIFVSYLLIKEDEIKISNFIGLCTIKRKKSSTITLKNTVKKEKIKLIINIQSPLVLKMLILKKHRKKFRLSKLYYK